MTQENKIIARQPSLRKFTHLMLHGVNERITVETREIAKLFGRLHKNVLTTIDSLIKDGTISRLEFKPRDYSSRGKKYPCYELTESGFLKAMPFIGGRRSREGQKLLVDEFMHLRKRLSIQSKERESLAFQMVRESGKNARSLLEDEIQKLSNYAKKNGSKNYNRYYSNITNAIYKSFLIIEPKANSVRGLLTPIQLSVLQTIELTIAAVISKELEKGTHYKTIYREHIKPELEKFVASKTAILAATDA